MNLWPPRTRDSTTARGLDRTQEVQPVNDPTTRPMALNSPTTADGAPASGRRTNRPERRGRAGGSGAAVGEVIANSFPALMHRV
jgi:hypothetical protein